MSRSAARSFATAAALTLSSPPSVSMISVSPSARTLFDTTICRLPPLSPAPANTMPMPLTPPAL